MNPEPDELSALSALTGPTLRWGEPCGQFELQIIPGGAVFIHRGLVAPRRLQEVSIRMTSHNLAELQGLLNMLVIEGPKPDIPEAADGRRILAN